MAAESICIYRPHQFVFNITVNTGRRPPVPHTRSSFARPWVPPAPRHRPPDHTAQRTPATIAAASCMPRRPVPSPRGPIRRRSKLLIPGRHSVAN